MSTTAITVATIGQFTLDPGGVLRASPGFGVRADGSCYFDPDGAATGESAELRVDQSGNPYLEYPAPATEEMLMVHRKVRAQADRLRARRARNVALIAAPRGQAYTTTEKAEDGTDG